MLTYQYVDLDFEPYIGPKPRSTGVFVREGRGEPITGELGKDWWPPSSPRQPYFETQVRRVAAAIGSRCVPTHIEWRSGEKNQLDKGCIGHSFAGSNAFIDSVARNQRDEITYVILREIHAPH